MILKLMAAAGLIVVTAAGMPGWTQTVSSPRPPTIVHEPVTLAVRGQPLSILARVTPGAAPIRSVSLYYAPSRDAAPVKQEMSSSGAGLYSGNVPASHFASAYNLFYYIEVVDAQEEWTETPWQQVRVQDPRSTAPPSAVLVDPAVPYRSGADGDRPPPQRGGMSTGKWIAGGALAAGAAVAIVAASGSGGGGSGTPGDGGNEPPPPDDPAQCTAADAVGTWLSTDQSVAPGFRILADGSALFFAPPEGDPGTGSWGLVSCDLTLIPSNPDSIYRGTGTLSADRTSLTISGSTFVKTP